MKHTKPILILAASLVFILGVVFIYFAGSRFLIDQPANELILEATSTQNIKINGQRAVDYPAPNFTLFDLNGEEKKLSDYKGKAIILNFWTTWSPISQDQTAILDSYYKKVKDDQNLAFLAINSQEDKSVISGFIRRGEYSLPVWLDEKGEAGELYKISILPITFFIDKNGRVKDVYIGVLSEEE